MGSTAWHRSPTLFCLFFQEREVSARTVQDHERRLATAQAQLQAIRAHMSATSVARPDSDSTSPLSGHSRLRLRSPHSPSNVDAGVHTHGDEAAQRDMHAYSHGDGAVRRDMHASPFAVRRGMADVYARRDSSPVDRYTGVDRDMEWGGGAHSAGGLSELSLPSPAQQRLPRNAALYSAPRDTPGSAAAPGIGAHHSFGFIQL